MKKVAAGLLMKENKILIAQRKSTDICWQVGVSWREARGWGMAATMYEMHLSWRKLRELLKKR